MSTLPSVTTIVPTSQKRAEKTMRCSWESDWPCSEIADQHRFARLVTEILVPFSRSERPYCLERELEWMLVLDLILPAVQLWLALEVLADLWIR